VISFFHDVMFVSSSLNHQETVLKSAAVSGGRFEIHLKNSFSAVAEIP